MYDVRAVAADQQAKLVIGRTIPDAVHRGCRPGADTPGPDSLIRHFIKKYPVPVSLKKPYFSRDDDILSTGLLVPIVDYDDVHRSGR